MGDMSREPSMEEILSSIRRVIARDEDARGGAPLPSPASLAGQDVLDDADEAQDDVLELTETSETAMARRPLKEPSPVSAQMADVEAPNLISADSAAASRNSIDALAAALAGGQNAAAQSASVPMSGDVTMSALVEAALRPMLKQWLDANLPPLVERIVATEIARITGGR